MSEAEADFLARAAALKIPIVVADTTRGSLDARFWLIDADNPPKTWAGSPALPRELFNELRKKGILARDYENRLDRNGSSVWAIDREFLYGEDEAV